MRRWTWLMAALAVAGTALAARAPASEACQTGRFFAVRRELFVLATARADTVRAGPGPIRYTHGDTAGLETIHGQRFRLDRVGGDVPAELAGAEGGEAILVPYGWECRETWRWREARWARPGAQVFIDAQLRPREQWVEGRPTFDVEVVHDWYPENYVDRYMDSVAEVLTPAQVFELNQVLPTWTGMEADTAAAFQRLLAWARANPGLAARFPATRTLEEAQEALQPCVPAYDPHPAAGTYRASVVLEQRDTLTFFFRTDRTGYPQCGPPEPRLDITAVQPRMADTALLYVQPAPGEAAAAGAGTCGGGSVHVLNPPQADADGRRGWRADFNYLALPYCDVSNARLHDVAQRLFAAYQAGARDDAPGWFRETADGGMRLEQAWGAEGRVLLEVRATRISPRTFD